MSTEPDNSVGAALTAAADQIEVGPPTYRTRVRIVIARRFAAMASVVIVIGVGFVGLAVSQRNDAHDLATSNSTTEPSTPPASTTGSSAPPASTGTTPESVVGVEGLSVLVPEGWSLTEANLSPYMSDPRGLFVVSSFPVDAAASQTPACDAQVPVSVAGPTTPAGAFVWVTEAGAVAIQSSQHEGRAVRLRPEMITAAGISDFECGDLAHLYNIWFEEDGRLIGIYIGIGDQTSTEDVDLAFQVANSLRPSP